MSIYVIYVIWNQDAMQVVQGPRIILVVMGKAVFQERAMTTIMI